VARQGIIATKAGSGARERRQPARKNRRAIRLSNSDIAELLAREAETLSGNLQRAFRRAARSAFLWPREAAEILAAGESLTSLAGIGPYFEKRVQAWIEGGTIVRPPPIRRDFLTLAQARAILSENPGWSKLLRGDLQMHSQWSDGSGTISGMAEAGSARGYEFIAITDHSKGLKIAGGIDEAALRKQAAEIESVNRRSSCQVLKSLEMNLNPRGEGDMDAAALAELDLVLGSFHSALRTKEDQTQRYLAALRNCNVHILGHPHGRVYNSRPGLSADWPRVFAEAAKLDKALEIDCYPDRQDLNVTLLRTAKREGARISLGTDAHHPWQLEFIELGLAAAQVAKIPAERITNFRPLLELKGWVAELRAKRGGS
jgi:histidinol phosphatase-like PHP family hydrolase